MDQQSKIAILGYGVEGKAILKYLEKHVYKNITVCDKDVGLKDKMPDGTSVRLGEKYLNDLTDFDVIFRSPGVKYLEPAIQAAFVKGVELTNCISYFLDQCPCPIIGVTGTKGKGTTSTLIYEMLKKKGLDAYLGGNIGDPAIEFLDKLTGKSIVVLEMSSFQLQNLTKSPHYSVMLNTTSDHLDYHADRDEYLQAKESILANQNKNSVAVLNKDYEYVNYYRPLIKGEEKLVSVKEKVKNGAYIKKNEIIYVKNNKEEKIANVKDVALIGSHNLENILPSVVIAKELGVATKDILDVIKKFKGLEHRLEFIKEVKEVKYYNDSYSTTPETSMAAVDSFDAPTILIAGGYDKGADYMNWATKILTRPSLEVVILIGKTSEKMDKALIEAEEKLGEAIGSPTKVIKRKSLEDAIIEAYSLAKKGGVIVMSPAAASFDMFKNYKERGETFKKLVKGLR